MHNLSRLTKSCSSIMNENIISWRDLCMEGICFLSFLGTQSSNLSQTNSVYFRLPNSSFTSDKTCFVKVKNTRYLYGSEPMLSCRSPLIIILSSWVKWIHHEGFPILESNFHPCKQADARKIENIISEGIRNEPTANQYNYLCITIVISLIAYLDYNTLRERRGIWGDTL